MDNPPAFPNIGNSTWGQPPCEGMSLRHYFAGQALVGLLASAVYHNAGEGFPEFIAAQVSNIADAMIAALSEPTPSPEGPPHDHQ